MLSNILCHILLFIGIGSSCEQPIQVEEKKIIIEKGIQERSKISTEKIGTEGKEDLREKEERIKQEAFEQKEIEKMSFVLQVEKLKRADEDCLEAQINTQKNCNISDMDFFKVCINTEEEFIFPPLCTKKKDIHLKTPEFVRSLYSTAYAIGNAGYYDNFVNIAENTEVNSLTIDVKTVTGYVSFEMDEKYFGKIQPVSDGRITNIKEIIKKLHKNNIYVIGRVVVFKDNLLSDKRPDLAFKWTGNTKKVWSDYSGKKYLDPMSQEVWDYNIGIASAAYELGFDEINFDYVRFPSDGRISQIYAPFSKDIIKEHGSEGKIKVLDTFSHYFTTTLRTKYPNIILSADVFGLVTNGDGKSIGQSLESFLLYFDFVGPMTYPSHYGNGFLGFSQPDNHPYEVIQDALKNANAQITRLNGEIELAKVEKRKIKLSNGLETSADTSKVTTIKKSQIRPWLQGFTCTWCPGATPYTASKFKKQTQAIKDMGGNSWWVWHSGSKYYKEQFNVE